MSKSQLPLLVGLTAAGGVGYYLYQSGGQPKVAEKRFESQPAPLTIPFPARATRTSVSRARNAYQVNTLQVTSIRQLLRSKASCLAAVWMLRRRAGNLARRLVPRLTPL